MSGEEDSTSRDHKLRPQYQSPSLISISSGSPASSAPSSRAGRKKKGTFTQQSSSYRPPSRLTEEDQLLLANRRRLLARTDWLGLAAARPMQMKFPSSRDKDRIGKRRKVERTGNRAKPAGRRLLTPLFDERLPRVDALMSGALPADDFRIKIGTDALASQTQRSRRSHTPQHTSVRQPSTEFGPLSEESMLLGADGDSSEAGKAVRNPFVTQHGAAQAPSMVAMAGSKFLEADDSVLASPEVHVESWQPSEAGEGRAEIYHPDQGAVPAKTLVNTHGARSVPQWKEADPRHNHRDPIDPASNMQHFGQLDEAENSHVKSSAHPAEDSDDGDDDTWRQLMKIQQYTSSHASIVALRSSSQHNTTSGSSHRPLLDRHEACEDMSLSTPRGAGTQGATIIEPFSHAMDQLASLHLRPRHSGRLSG
ncbi:hypothetical protein LTR36_001570 [Oleoguttula mirabilis]|uniref:Uncharacterized protein n=1 Tax=Oleoguttula mirabilis TaxID=1507867 RepID=A0AAV9JQL7_9PEZI|nr:hypothetical protein LTR36_001570 [Oleoguttula mirabilis]